MTDMRRVTISLPEDIDKRILKLKKTNKFVRESYSEIVRQLLLKGLEKESKDKVSWEEVGPVNKYAVQLEMPKGKVGEILEKLSSAQETIRECYQELEGLGVLVIKEETASGN